MDEQTALAILRITDDPPWIVVQPASNNESVD